MRKFILLFSLFVSSICISAQDIAYYKNQNIETKSGAALKTALFNLISPHTAVGYGGLYDVYKTSDNKGNNKVWDMYSTCEFTHGSKGGNANVCSGYNREHMIPQSWIEASNYDGKAQSAQKCDAYHVYPTDCKVNGARSNYPHAETNDAPLSENPRYGDHALGKVGTCSVKGFTGKVYEPINEYKGDIARTYFYFATCYEGFSTTHENGRHVFMQAFPGFQNWFLNLMLKWHYNDPVSQKEINRNNAVFVHQRNRNPFIDYPALVDHIWGKKNNEPFYFTNEPLSLKESGYEGWNNDGGNNGGNEGGNEGGEVVIPGCTPISYSGLTSDLTGFTDISVSGYAKWKWDKYRGKQYAKMSGFDDSKKVSIANEDWLISPSFNLLKMKSAIVTFDHIINFANISTMKDDMSVWVSTDFVEGAQPYDATWTQLKGFAYPKGNSWDNVAMATINLSKEYMTENVHIAFKYVSTSTYSGTWEVYNFNLISECTPVTSVEQVIKPEYDVLSDHNSITIMYLSNNSNVILRDICGRVLYHDNITSSEHTINVPQSGVYLLTVNNKTTKVVVY